MLPGCTSACLLDKGWALGADKKTPGDANECTAKTSDGKSDKKVAVVKGKEYTAKELVSSANKALGYEGLDCKNDATKPGTGFALMCKEGRAPSVKTLITAWDYSKDKTDPANGKKEISVAFAYKVRAVWPFTRPCACSQVRGPQREWGIEDWGPAACE